MLHFIDRTLRALSLSLFLAAPALAAPGDIYVDDDAVPGGDGTSWATAYMHLQDGILASVAGDTIHVGQGTYQPDLSEGNPTWVGNRYASFRISHSLAVMGGYAGLGAVDPNDNAPDIYVTTLTGDLLGNDPGLLDSTNVDEFDPLRLDNSAHVVTVLTSTAVILAALDGLTIEGAFAYYKDPTGGTTSGGSGGTLHMFGGGILCAPIATNEDTESLTYLSDCRVRGNYAYTGGGGICNAGNVVYLAETEITDNAARVGAGYLDLGCLECEDDGAIDPEGLLLADRVLWQKNYLMFTDNAAMGGAVCLYLGEGVILDSVFLDNSAFSGALDNGRGGAIYVGSSSSLQAYNNTFKDNIGSAGPGGANLWCEERIEGLDFANNICWDAVPLANHMVYPAFATDIGHFGFNDIEGLDLPAFAVVPGNDVDVDPQFADAMGRLGDGSPCVDAGWNGAVPNIADVDFDGLTRIMDDHQSAATGWGGAVAFGPHAPGVRPIVDMGAFEYLRDCNENGIPDSDDIANGTSSDCEPNGVPDECEPDCDDDGLPDDCEDDCNADGTPDDCQTLPDCDSNGVPDACEPMDDCNNNDVPDRCEDDCDDDGIPDDCEDDCDNDGLPDDCEEDCNSDGVPDDCQSLDDCDSNGVPDACEPMDDCNGNGVPDRCEPDCDGDGVPDDCEEDCNNDGTPDDCQDLDDCDLNGVPDMCEPMDDCNGNGIPDRCEPDCDGDGLPDDCEVDCNSDGVPDDCQVLDDCDSNGVPDICEPMDDCNGNGVPDRCEPDCDGDGIPDACEEDCNSDGVPDECQALEDCNSDGIPDICQDLEDCNSDGVPDECQALDDCNNDGIPDECQELADCNMDGIPDVCQALDDCDADGTPDVCQMIDCNGNGVLDECDIANGVSDDCDMNGIPDECEMIDCNGNGILDSCDIASGASEDCDANGEPDECQPDCNGNGVVDSCDVLNGTSEDCNENMIPDECEEDCNGNGIPDECDIADGTSEDCNGNEVPDECELPEGDQDHNGVLDDCEINCVEFDRSRMLTGRDTITLITNVDNPELEAGYVYVHAINHSSEAISFNHLVGQELIVDGIDSFDYSVNAIDFRAGVKIMEQTDVDGDGNLDMNGTEYEMAPNEILVPRFFGNDPGADALLESQLVLLGLSGGREFSTTVDFMVYNDNEEAFSAEYTFKCWDKVMLERISGVFSADFLSNYTNHDPMEIYGAPTMETGWFRMSGHVANSNGGQISNPAVYGVLVERGGMASVADLPFEAGSRVGHLLPGHLQGDNDEWDGANWFDPDANVSRRAPGSLLLYPEFDNRNGVVSVLSVTNTSHEGVNVHFVYTGRWKQF